jgi:hypothetical protein
MHRVGILAGIVGVLIGIVGGVLGGAVWLGVGAAVALVGVAALWGLAIWKNPSELMKVESDVEAMASGFPTRVMEPMAQGEIRSTPTSTLALKKGHSDEPAP